MHTLDAKITRRTNEEKIAGRANLRCGSPSHSGRILILPLWREILSLTQDRPWRPKIEPQRWPDTWWSGPSVKRLKNLFDGHPTWQEVIRERGSRARLEV